MSFKRLNQLQENKEKIADNVREKLQVLTDESKKVLNGLGVKSDTYSLGLSDLQEIVADIKHYNQSPKAFFKNLDFATYDARQKIQWTSSMLVAYTKLQFENEVSPKIVQYKDLFLKQVDKVKSF